MKKLGAAEHPELTTLKNYITVFLQLLYYVTLTNFLKEKLYIKDLIF